MRKTLAVLLMFLALPAFAGSDDSAKYNELYKNEDYQGAYEGYASMLKKDRNNPDVWYNAGNALYRLNRAGDAIYAYVKAFTLNPRDSDIRFNLEFAMRQTGQNFVPDGTPKSLYYLFYYLSDGELRAAAAVFFWLAVLFGSLYFFIGGTACRYAVKTAVVSASLCVFSLVWFGARYHSQFSGNVGVVTEKAGVRIYSGPGDNFKDCASAPEGMIVKIMNDSDGDYYEIGLQKDGVSGWALKTGVQKI